MNRGGMGKFVIFTILDKINRFENIVEIFVEAGVFLGEYSAVVTVGIIVTVLSPGNGKLLLVIPWSLVSVADLCLSVPMEAEIIKVGTVEAAEVGTVEAGNVSDTKVRVAKVAGCGDTKVGEALDTKCPTAIATAPSGGSQLTGYGAHAVVHPR